MINKIEAQKDNLRKSEQKVAALVLARPNMITNMSLAEVAAKAGVSEPTVVRFCRAIGCGGFQDLKVKLIGEAEDRGIEVLEGMVMQLDDYLVTRMVEAVVHADDLAVSIGVDTTLVLESNPDAGQILNVAGQGIQRTQGIVMTIYNVLSLEEFIESFGVWILVAPGGFGVQTPALDFES